ncbi:CDT1 domain-containing protein [Psidium guajava]|nr:CDT1 domain-containing protein [Psidium guajava]
MSEDMGEKEPSTTELKQLKFLDSSSKFDEKSTKTERKRTSQLIDEQRGEEADPEQQQQQQQL